MTRVEPTPRKRSLTGNETSTERLGQRTKKTLLTLQDEKVKLNKFLLFIKET